jgi:cyclic dehypoxanthinyl futalosine synthase
MKQSDLNEKIVAGEKISDREAYELNHLPLPLLMYGADSIRKKLHPEGIVTYIIDRNVNITNVCFSFCDFCSFCRAEGESDTYVTSIEEYQEKITELFAAGGNQLLLQGGMHPELGLDYYVGLFRNLKRMFPELYLHALSPSEIFFLSQKEQMPVRNILMKLTEAGLDSLPGGGAEILSDRVRKELSPLKADSSQWLHVMREAHMLGISTTATMMFGHIETPEERIEHMLKIRSLQKESDDKGFISFIPWTFQPGNTRLIQKFPGSYKTSAHEYLRVIAISRILLHNIPNIQASWLTVGTDTASVALHCGANDMGSIMLEENVVASAGVKGKLTVSGMEELILNSGFQPAKRNQSFQVIDVP